MTSNYGPSKMTKGISSSKFSKLINGGTNTVHNSPKTRNSLMTDSNRKIRNDSRSEVKDH